MRRCHFAAMRKTILLALLTASPAAPALADNYPVYGCFGVTASTGKGTIDCTGRRVIGFNGNQRTDTGGGVPSYRNLSVTPAGQGHYRIVDEFSNGLISGGRVAYTLVQQDADHIKMQLQQGGTLKLQRYK
jgi:hypothetical protein